MSLGAINKETGRATYDEILRLRQRIDTLERFRGGLTQALIQSGTTEGPVGSSGTYLRLDASNGPITGSLTFNSTIFVIGQINGADMLLTGNATVNGTLQVDGKTTISATLNATGAVVFGSTLNVVGDADFDANVNMDGTLQVDGKTTLSDTLNVVGNTDLDANLNVDGTMQVDGLTTHSDMIHISAPTVGIASLRMVSGGGGFSTMSPDNTVSLSGHELWLDSTGVTASDSVAMDKWTSVASPFSGDGFTKDSTGPVWNTSGGANNLPYATLNSGSGNYVDSGSDHVFGNAGVGLTMFLVYRVSSGGSADNERALVGQSNTAGQRGGMRPPGPGSGISKFAFMDASDSGNKKTVSDALTTEPANSAWVLCVMRKNTSNVWFNAFTVAGSGSIEEANDSFSDDGRMNIKAIGKDQSNNAFDGAGIAEFIGYTADIGEDRMKDIWNFLAEKYAFTTFDNGGGAGGGVNQTDFLLGQNSADNILFRVDTLGQCAVGGTTLSATLHVHGDAIFTDGIVAADAALTGIVSASGLVNTGHSTLSNVSCNNLTAAGTLQVVGEATLSSTLFSRTLNMFGDDFKIKLGAAQDAIIRYDGSNLIIEPRAVGTGDLRIELDGSAELRFGAASGGYIDRAVNLNLNIQRLSAGDLYLVRGGGDIVVGGNSPVTGANLTVAAGNVNILTPGVLEGDRFTVCFGNTLFTASKYLDVPTGGIASATYGFIAQRDGSIMGIGWNHNAAVIIADDTLTYEVRVAGVNVFQNGADSSTVSGKATQARGVDTFSEGDVINVFVTAGGSFNGTIGISTNVDIVYDD